MRFALPLLTLFATLAPAAPVPVNRAAERQQFERWWTDLTAYDPVVRTRAVFALLDHPRAVEFLAEKVPPVKASEDQLKGWLNDLNSDDEEVWKPAFEGLEYHDPSTELTLVEQREGVHSHVGRHRLATIWCVGLPALQSELSDTTLTLDPNHPSGRKATFAQSYRNGGCTTGFVVPPVADMRPVCWQRAAVAAVLLHRRDTKASRQALAGLAAGHKDALPTRVAAELLDVKRPAERTDKQFEADWAGVLTGEPVAAARWAVALADHPDDVKRLAAKLPAIKVTKPQATAWLKAVDHADPKVWKPALEQLLYFRPQLALSPEEQSDAVTTNRGRWAVYDLYSRWTFDMRADFPWEAKIEPLADTEGLVIRGDDPHQTSTSRAESLDAFTPAQWERARMAIVALERMKSDEAKAVLKQLANGHPDILPTKEAKAALERLKK